MSPNKVIMRSNNGRPNDWCHAIISIHAGSWGQHGAHLGPVGPWWAPCWPMNLAIRGLMWIFLRKLTLLHWDQTTHCCLMMPYNDKIWINIGQTAQSHYLTNADLSWVRSSNIHLAKFHRRNVSLKTSLKITYLKFHWDIPEANELSIEQSMSMSQNSIEIPW